MRARRTLQSTPAAAQRMSTLAVLDVTQMELHMSHRRPRSSPYRVAIFLTFASWLTITSASTAQEPDAQLTAALESYRTGDFDDALRRLEPLLAADDLQPTVEQRVRELALRVLQARGEDRFRHARIAEAIADFDRQIQLQPQRAPEHWQRGIAYYYAGDFEKGRRQFELHRTVNPQDVENAAWHFLCAARAPKGSVAAARKGLIAVSRDARIPMAQIQKMFAGEMMPEDVLREAATATDVAKFYADLYVGLYYEALGQSDQSLRLVSRAAENPAAKDNFMGDVARVHVLLRKQATPRNQPRSLKTAQ